MLIAMDRTGWRQISRKSAIEKKQKQQEIVLRQPRDCNNNINISNSCVFWSCIASTAHGRQSIPVTGWILLFMRYKGSLNLN